MEAWAAARLYHHGQRWAASAGFYTEIPAETDLSSFYILINSGDADIQSLYVC